MSNNEIGRIKHSAKSKKTARTNQAADGVVLGKQLSPHRVADADHSLVFHVWSGRPYAFRLSEDGGWEIDAKELTLRHESHFAESVVAALSIRFKLKPSDIRTRMVFRRVPQHKQQVVNVGLWIGVANSASDVHEVRSCYEREIQPNWENILATATTRPSDAQVGLPFEAPTPSRDEPSEVAQATQTYASPASTEPAEATRRLVAAGIASRLAGKHVAGVQLSAAEGEPFKYEGAIERTQSKSGNGVSERFVGHLLGLSRVPDTIKLHGASSADPEKEKNWKMSFVYSEPLARRIAKYVALPEPSSVRLEFDVLRFDEIGVGSTTSRYELRDFAESASRSVCLFSAANDPQTSSAPPPPNEQAA